MHNKIENKLVTTSESGNGQEFYLSQGRTSIGSAPDNDVQFDSPDVSGFHAEFRIEKNSFFISDFSSKKGTFVNGERIAQKKQVAAGDIIQVGSMQTVFFPLNAILVKENSRRTNSQDAAKNGAPNYKKWLIMACVFLVMMSAIKVTLGKNKNRNTQIKETKAQETKIAGVAPSAKDKSLKRNEQKGLTAKSTLRYSVGSPDQTPNDTSDSSIANRQKKAVCSHQDNIANINFNIANKFADYQLWRDALEHYRSVLDKTPDYPGLSAKIAQMQSEIESQIVYQQGEMHLNKGSYKEGIVCFKNIDEKSFYFDKAVQAIAVAEEKMARPTKDK